MLGTTWAQKQLKQEDGQRTRITCRVWASAKPAEGLWTCHPRPTPKIGTFGKSEKDAVFS
eukprot:5479148-Amphidinium_carterae.1